MALDTASLHQPGFYLPQLYSACRSVPLCGSLHEALHREAYDYFAYHSLIARTRIAQVHTKSQFGLRAGLYQNVFGDARVECWPQFAARELDVRQVCVVHSRASAVYELNYALSLQVL